MTITATIIQDSINVCGNRLVTFELHYPRFIHSQIMTHRVFSRNVSSSRAIPVTKMIESVENDPVRPSYWGKNQKGMSSKEELDDDVKRAANAVWNLAMRDAINYAHSLANLGVHKQIVNRVLEPYMHVTTLLTGTDFDNFFALRIHEGAQPEIQVLAHAMLDAMELSNPTKVHPQDWHLPYAEDWGLDYERLAMSVARSARVSYNLHGTNERSSLGSDSKLHERLAESGHWSPFEHQAMALGQPIRVANFTGWIQYRQFLTNKG